ncbi:MAG: L-threonylcarbamoyladenylate synthase [Candidatus Ornithospirochaeta sp.]
MADIIEYGMESAAEVAERMKRGEVGIFPCDTIYGICAKVSPETMERIYMAKDRPQSKRLLVLSDKASLSSLVVVPKEIEALWPAPLTVILPTPDGDTLAVRVPDDPFLSRVIAISGPIFSTSVNLSGSPSLQNFDDILPVFGNRVDFIVRKVDLVPGQSSTLVDATKKPCRVVRQGSYIFREDII